MKRFDKGYIYSCLVTDILATLAILFLFLKDFFIGEDASAEEVKAAIPLFVIGFVLIYLCFFVYRVLYYRTSGYEMTENEIRCQRGVLFKKRSLLEYRKVHAINKKQNIIQRIFGIAVLTVDSGSANTAHQAEITVIEKEKTVDALMRELNALKDGARAEEAGGAQAEVLISDKDSLYRFTSKRKMLYTLINIASTAFFTALFAILTVIVLAACKWVWQPEILGSWGRYFLFAALITVGAVLLFSLFSFIGCMLRSFIGYHNFTVTKEDSHIRISYGLLEKHTNAFHYDRIKAVKISQGLVQRMLGFATIKLEVIGYTTDGEDGNAALGVLVPFCKYDEVGEILGKVLPAYVPDEKETRAVSYFPFVSWFLLILGTVTGVVLLQVLSFLLCLHASPAVILAVSFALIGAGAVVFIVKALHAALSYRNNGLALRDGKVTAYFGGFTRTVTVFMTKSLVAAENVTTPLRKKAGITSLVMHLKTNAQSNEIKVHMQEDALSKEMEQLLNL